MGSNLVENRGVPTGLRWLKQEGAAGMTPVAVAQVQAQASVSF